MNEFNKNTLQAGDYITNDLREGDTYFVKDITDGKIMVDRVSLDPKPTDRDIIWVGPYIKMGYISGEYDPMISVAPPKKPIGRVNIVVEHNKKVYGGWGLAHTVYEGGTFDLVTFIKEMIYMKLHSREGTVKTGDSIIKTPGRVDLNSVDLKDWTIKISMTD